MVRVVLHSAQRHLNSSDQDGDLKTGVAESLLDLAFNGAIALNFGGASC